MGFSEMTDILGWEWIDFDELGSTNDKARELTAEPPAKRFVVTAETQNKGRGRRGRNWETCFRLMLSRWI